MKLGRWQVCNSTDNLVDKLVDVLRDQQQGALGTKKASRYQTAKPKRSRADGGVRSLAGKEARSKTQLRTRSGSVGAGVWGCWNGSRSLWSLTGDCDAVGD